METRIVKIPDERNLILGRDLAKMLEPGIIYRAEKFMDSILLTPIGKTCLSEKVGLNGISIGSDVGQMVRYGTHLITDIEREEIHEHYLNNPTHG